MSDLNNGQKKAITAICTTIKRGEMKRKKKKRIHMILQIGTFLDIFK